MAGKVAARLRLSFANGERGTELVALAQQAPLRALFPRPSAGDLPEAVLVTTSGGLVGGDQLAIAIEVGPGARALVTSQAAEKVYRSAGPEVRLGIDLHAAENAWLEWLPQETILFEGARLCRHTTVHLASSARVLAAEIVVFGRHAHGEALTTGLLVDAWRLHRGGHLAWADSLRLDQVREQLALPFALAGARAMATLVHAAPDAGAWLDRVRDRLAATPVRCGATALPGVLVVRWLSDDPAALRRQVAELAADLRHAIAGLPARLPTTWWT